MAWGVEGRSPYLDYRVMEYGLGLKADDKVNINGGLTTKVAFRQALRQFLPKEIFSRKDKIGFSSNISNMLMGEWRPMVEKLQEVLRHAYPLEEYYQQSLSDQVYDRRTYQLFQLGITHLLFCEGWKIEEVTDFLEG